MRSHLLEGRVRHRRSTPFVHALDHAVWYAALDLDELDRIDGRLRLFGRNRTSVTEFRVADHLPEPATDIAGDVRRHLVGEGIDPSGWRITLVTNLRVMGYVFNPASFYLCRDAAGDLRVVVVEVHNTHDERHLYTLRSSGADGAPFRAGMDKAFYVSPFLSMDGQYQVHVRDDEDRLTIAINERADGVAVLATSLVLRRLPLTDRGLLRMLVRHPFVTHRTIGLIHWHALRLWLRGARFHRHGDAARPPAARPTDHHQHPQEATR
jgi:DUF1365 family protein